MFRASNIDALFAGQDGLSDAQKKELDRLMARKADYESGNQKAKLTDKMEADLSDLKTKAMSEPELPQGARTLVEEIVDADTYQYTDSYSSRELDKGHDVEDENIDLYNRVFFTDHKKLVDGDKYASLSYNNITGHPDIVDEVAKMVKDAKSSWNKKTFKKKISDAKNSKYEWQVRTYLYMLQGITGDKSWRTGEYFYGLVDTPESLVPEWENDSLHNTSGLDDNLRLTVIPVELTDEMVAHMDRRIKMAMKYADEYRSFLINKNK
jgi:hypothetical protein